MNSAKGSTKDGSPEKLSKSDPVPVSLTDNDVCNDPKCDTNGLYTKLNIHHMQHKEKTVDVSTKTETRKI